MPALQAAISGRTLSRQSSGPDTSRPGTPVDIAYSPYDDGLYVCTQSDGVFYVPDVITAAGETPEGETGEVPEEDAEEDLEEKLKKELLNKIFER